MRIILRKFCGKDNKHDLYYMVNYFELYGLPVSFHPDATAVKAKFYELSRQYHPDRYAQAGEAALDEALRMAAMNNDAYKTLKSSDALMAYILKLNALLQDDEKYALPPAFLMEMMDINEALSEYEIDRENKDALQMVVNGLNEQLELWDGATAVLTDRYDNGEQSKELLLQIKDQYFRKKYLLRIKERIDRFAAQTPGP
jgi:molecular chaperone HscB